MEQAGTATPSRVGRPRRFDPEVERAMVLDAALDVLARRGYGDASVGEILAEAGLSTRAFYRHFESKEALLVALVGRETAKVAATLERAVASAGDPRAAVDAWVERFLDVFFEERRAARTAMFSAPSVRAAYPVADVLRDMRRQFCRPLADALRAGDAAGMLTAPNPEAHAASLFALVSALADRQELGLDDRAAAKDHVVRFAWPALGLDGPA